MQYLYKPKMVGILILVDVLLTYIGISIGIVEANPVARSLGFTLFILLKLLAGIAVYLLDLDKYPYRFHRYWLTSLSVFLILAILWNVKIILDFVIGPVT